MESLNRLSLTSDAITSSFPLTPLTRRVKKYPRRMQQCSICSKLSGIGSSIHACMKIKRHGQTQILTQQEIELLFNKGLQTACDRTLFGVCLYTACRIAKACSLEVIDIYTARGTVRPTINFRKANTKGQLQTKTIPVIEDLRSLLTSWKPHAGKTYLFPGRHPNHHWKHLHPDSADKVLREAFEQIGIEGASTHSFRRTALTQMSNAGIPLRIIQEISGHSNLEQLQHYLEVKPDRVKATIASLSMLSYTGKFVFPHIGL